MGAAPEADAPVPDSEELCKLIKAGLTPQEVAAEYFRACWEDKPLLWLATLHIDARSVCASSRPGPFRTCQWEEGRARVEKYMVSYKYLGEADSGVSPQNDAYITLKYLPLYGPIPGYEPGKPLGMEITLVLRRQGGVGGEWRIAEGGF